MGAECLVLCGEREEGRMMLKRVWADEPLKM